MANHSTVRCLPDQEAESEYCSRTNVVLLHINMTNLFGSAPKSDRAAWLAFKITDHAIIAARWFVRHSPDSTPLKENISARALANRTTRYLTSVERRLHYLEKLVAQKLPDVDVDDALASLATASPSTQLAHVKTISFPPAQRPLGVTGLSSSSKDQDAHESISEAVPEEADGFDWQEEANDLVDGMAALAVEPTGTGYLGLYPIL